MRNRWAKARSKDGFGVADPIVDAVNRANFQIWGAATDAIFSPDGNLVAITGPANPDGSVRLFDAATGKLVRTLTGGRGAAMTPPFNYGNTFAFSPDGSSLVAAPVALTIKIWDVHNGELRAELPIRGISSFLLTADGAALVSAHDNGSIIFRCLTRNFAVVSLQAHEGAIDSLSADRAGQLLATGATDQTAGVWRMPKSSDICGIDQPDRHFDLLSVLRPAAILAGHGARITKAVFSPDDRTVITASQDGWLRGWSFGADAETTDVALPESDGQWENAIASSDGRSVFAYHSGRYQWYGWETETGQSLSIPDSVQVIAPGKDHGPVLVLRWSQNGGQQGCHAIVTAGSEPRRVSVREFGFLLGKTERR
jgi:WD40 repeat protein